MSVEWNDAPRRRGDTAKGFIERYAIRDQLRAVFKDGNENWLSEAERRELAHWRNPDRRDAWLCDRWLSKQLIDSVFRTQNSVLGTRYSVFREISITSRDDQSRSVRPTVSLRGEVLPWTLSISHSDRAVLVVVSTIPETTVGVDLVDIQTSFPRSAWERCRSDGNRSSRDEALLRHAPSGSSASRSASRSRASRKAVPKQSLGTREAFETLSREPQASAPVFSTGLHNTWFTERERTWLAEVGPEGTAAVWAVKEAVYKAINDGEGFAPRRIEIGRASGEWQGRYRGAALDGRCRIVVKQLDGHVAAAVLLHGPSVDVRQRNCSRESVARVH